jgi:hypothetical protein
MAIVNRHFPELELLGKFGRILTHNEVAYLVEEQEQEALPNIYRVNTRQ